MMNFIYNIYYGKGAFLDTNWAIALIGSILVGLYLYRTNFFKYLSKENIKNDAKFLFWTTVVCLFTELLSTTYIPNVGDISNKSIGIFKIFLAAFKAVFPVGCSLYLCNNYWKEFQKDMDNYKWDTVYPSLMVSQGTFYTFIGVTVVLLTYNPDPRATNAAANAISGLRLAFLTSVIGLLYSIVAKIVLKIKMSEAASTTDRLQTNSLSENDFYLVLTKMYDMLSKYHEQTSKLIKDTQDEQFERQKEQLEKIYSRFDASISDITRQMNENISATFNNIETTTKRISATLGLIANTYESINSYVLATHKKLGETNNSIDMLNSKLIDCGEVVSGYKDDLAKASEVFTGYASNLNELNLPASFASLKSGVDDITTSLNNTAASIDSNITTKLQDAAREIADYSSAISGIKLNDSISRLESGFNTVAKSLDSVASITKSSGEFMNKVSSDYYTLSQKQQENVNAIAELAATVDKRIKTVEQKDTAIFEKLKEVQGAFTDSIEKNTVAFGNILKQSQDINSNLGNIHAIISDNIKESKNLANILHSYTANYAEFEANLRNRIENSSKLAIEAVYTNFEKNTNEIEKAMVNAQQRYIDNLNGSQGKYMENLGRLQKEHIKTLNEFITSAKETIGNANRNTSGKGSEEK